MSSGGEPSQRRAFLTARKSAARPQPGTDSDSADSGSHDGRFRSASGTYVREQPSARPSSSNLGADSARLMKKQTQLPRMSKKIHDQVPFSPNRRPLSTREGLSRSFIPSVAPLRTLPVKEGDPRPAHIVVGERREVENMEKGEYALGPTTSTPRRRLSAMTTSRPSLGRHPLESPLTRRSRSSRNVYVDFNGEVRVSGSEDEAQTGSRTAKKSGSFKARKLPRIIYISDSSEELDELRDAFDALSLSTIRLQQYGKLPFLRRNLAKGFKAQCLEAGVPVSPASPPEGKVHVIYRYYPEDRDSDEANSDPYSDEERECQTFKGFMPDWRCPICELHKPFSTWQMLEFHLKRDHEETKPSWSHRTTRGVRHVTIRLTIPDLSDSDEESSSEDEPSSLPGTPALQDANVSVEESPQPRRPRFPLVRKSFLQESDEAPTSPVLPSPHLDEGSEEKKFVLLPGPSRKGRPSLTIAPRRSYRGSLPERYPSPPPPTNRLGPAAQYPYLPDTDADGQQLYSCRVGGPRIFDLLNTLPTEEFGLLSWAIIDREEEIFEIEDVRDEDKMMLAIWNRWIMLHRSMFIRMDNFERLKIFIDEYWLLIHQGAGWRALRAFLVMLAMRRFMTFDKIGQLLRQYEGLTGMDLWYEHLDGPNVQAPAPVGDRLYLAL